MCLRENEIFCSPTVKYHRRFPTDHQVRRKQSRKRMRFPFQNLRRKIKQKIKIYFTRESADQQQQQRKTTQRESPEYVTNFSRAARSP